MSKEMFLPLYKSLIRPILEYCVTVWQSKLRGDINLIEKVQRRATKLVGLIKDRSGYAHKHGIHCLAGVIDSGYRGEIGVVMINLGDEPFEIKRDMKIAQMIILQNPEINLVEVESLDDTTRGHGGFGSTGKH